MAFSDVHSAIAGGIAVVGGILLVAAEATLHRIALTRPRNASQTEEAKADAPVERETYEKCWAVAHETAMNLFLVFAGNFFALYCLRGIWAYVSAGMLLVILSTIGSHFRFRQMLLDGEVPTDTLRFLMRRHWVASVGTLLLLLGCTAVYLIQLSQIK